VSVRVLYVSQTGMTEPLGQAQVLPYLVGLARAGFSIEIVGFEPEDADAREIARVREQLSDHGIDYSYLVRRRRHDWSTKIREASLGLLMLLTRALARRPRLVHARSTFASTVAHLAARMVPKTRMLFDCRGLVADEYADFGHWQRGAFRYRVLKAAENNLFRRVDAIVVLTERVRDFLRDEALAPGSTPIEVVPCCVDLDRFVFSDAARAEVRRELDAGDRFVLAYSGSLGACYSDEEMAALFAAVRQRRPSLFVVYSRFPPTRLFAALDRLSVPRDEVRVRPAQSREMPRMLSAADAAISFIEPSFSKIASSPTKVAEYLAIGLPIAVNRGIGDQDRLIASFPEVFVDAGRLAPADIDAAAETLVAAATRPETRTCAQAVASRHFSLAGGVERYRRLYESLAA
jgi:glycosyltransferase involved in cell wall biosynthesis